MVNLLKPLQGKTVKISILGENDPETSKFGYQLNAVLKEAGINSEAHEALMAGGEVKPGISFFANSEEAATAGKIAEALTLAGLGQESRFPLVRDEAHKILEIVVAPKH